MTDKEKIRAYIESQIALLEKNDTGNPVFGVSAGVVMAELKHLLSFIDSLQEEPVSNDLEAEFVLYLKHKFNIPQEGNTLKTDGWKPSPYDILDIAKHFAQWQALHSLETIKGMEEQAFLAGVEAEQINKSFSKEELLNRWRNKQ